MMLSHNHHKEHAVQFAKRILDKFNSVIVTVLSCFDRVIFKGYLPFHNEGELNSWVDDTQTENGLCPAGQCVHSAG